MKKTIARAASVAALIAGSLVLTACGSGGDPLGGGSATSSGSSDTIVIGSQAYYSNEIIAEIYAQALEADGQSVERNFNIGQRDAYMPALQSGEITLFPEYTGNLLQWLDKSATASSSEDVYAALQKAMPEGLTVLDQSGATDQDAYTVTAAFAKEHNLKEIGDLVGIPNLTLGGATELETRPYGPKALKEVYGVDVIFDATADTTVDELVAGNIQLADVYSADPMMTTKNLVALEDPKNLIVASHVVPVVTTDAAAKVERVINEVSAKLSGDALIALNVASVTDKKSATVIAKEWLDAQGLVK